MTIVWHLGIHALLSRTMARSKQNKTQPKKVDGRYRPETREERRLRLQQQEESRQKCMKLMPWMGAMLVVLALLFSLYVRSFPSKVAIRRLERNGSGFPNVTFEDIRDNGPIQFKVLNPEAETETVQEASTPSEEETIEL